jgi:hypothetical protein
VTPLLDTYGEELDSKGRKCVCVTASHSYYKPGSRERGLARIPQCPLETYLQWHKDLLQRSLSTPLKSQQHLSILPPWRPSLYIWDIWVSPLSDTHPDNSSDQTLTVLKVQLVAMAAEACHINVAHMVLVDWNGFQWSPQTQSCRHVNVPAALRA